MSYARKLIRQAQRQAQRAGGVAVVTVYHDRNCGHWRGGPCNCRAVIGRARPVGPFAVGDGSVSRGGK